MKMKKMPIPVNEQHKYFCSFCQKEYESYSEAKKCYYKDVATHKTIYCVDLCYFCNKNEFYVSVWPKHARKDEVEKDLKDKNTYIMPDRIESHIYISNIKKENIFKAIEFLKQEIISKLLNLKDIIEKFTDKKEIQKSIHYSK